VDVTIWVALLAGLVSFLSPCVFPLVPAYIGYMSGRVSQTVTVQAGGELVAGRYTAANRAATVLHGFLFVLGFTLIFVVFGLATTAFIRQIGGQNLALMRDIIGRVGGLLIIFFGLQFMGVLPGLISRLRSSRLIRSPLLGILALVVCSALALWALVDALFALPVIVVVGLSLFLGGAFAAPETFWNQCFDRLQQILYADTRRSMAGGSRGGLASSFVLGIVFAAGWTPCIGPIYGSILTLAATGGDVGQAGGLMVAYSLGLGLPFLACALILDGAQRVLRRLRGALLTVERASGAFLILIGILVASGQLQLLSQNFATQFADFSYRLEACAVGLTDGSLTLGELPSCVQQSSDGQTASAGL
jgi:cytochrome c-type biogenesis protein